MKIIINVIPFDHPEEERTFGFYKEKQIGFYPIKKFEYPKQLWADQEDVIKDLECLYTNLTNDTGADFYSTLKFRDSFNFAYHYYRHKLFNYFLDKADAVEMGFVNDVTCWFKDEIQSDPAYDQYTKYTLRVQYGKVSRRMELALMFDGISLVYKTPISLLNNIPPDHVVRVIHNKQVYNYQKNGDLIKHDIDNIFPIVNRQLFADFSIDREIKKIDNKYIPYHQGITSFYDKYLNNPDFQSIIHLDPNGFLKLDPSQSEVIYTKSDSNKLIFGKDNRETYQLGIEPKKDFLKLGPYSPSPFTNVRLIFIYHKPDKKKYIGRLFNVLKNGLPDQYVAFPALSSAIKQNLQLDDATGWEFESLETVVSEIRTKAINFKKEPNTQYIAIYVSPINKAIKDTDRFQLYFNIKEVLLGQSISSQVIFKENIFSTSLKWFLPNIAIAMLAKLGGIPWRLNRDFKSDLIVGVGAFYSETQKVKFIGSTFCFNNDGTFQDFNCIPANQTELLAGEISKAIMKYVVDNHEKAQRLIIHFYKKISEAELQPIIDVLHTFNWNIPVIVITINKTLSNDYVAFDLDSKNLMPTSGSIIPIGRDQYLLFNNTRYTESESVKDNPFPIKLTFSSQTPDILGDKLMVKELIDGVYQFSRMYWKSVRQQNLPVTIVYPEMAAEIFSFFDSDDLPPFGKKNLWFL